MQVQAKSQLKAPAALMDTLMKHRLVKSPTLDEDNDLMYISDSYCSSIKVLDLKTQQVSLIAGINIYFKGLQW